MNESNYLLLIDFLKLFWKNHFKKELDINILNLNSTIENDLQITGDDADFFLTALSKRFNLETKDFNGRIYFGHESETFDIIFPVSRFFFGEKRWMPIQKNKRKPLTLAHLVKCIDNKKLV